MLKPRLVGLRVGMKMAFRCVALLLATAFLLHAQDTDPTPLRSASEVDYPPFCIVHEDGRADGFSVELLRAALAAMGREVTFRTGEWPEVRGLLERGEIAALPLVGRTPEREAVFDFTVPYLTMHGAIVVRQETTDIQSLDQLRGRRVAVMKGDNAEEFLRREDRGLEIITTPTFTEAFHSLLEGRCDAVVIQRLVALRLLAETGLTNLKIVKQPVWEFSQSFCFAVTEGDRETLALLNEGLALVVADGTYRHLHAKWFAALQLPADRPLIIGGDHQYPPYEYLDEKGRPTGFNVELTRAIAVELGIEIRFALGPWAEVLEQLQLGKIDAVQGLFYTAERDRLFDFSQPYLVSHYVSVVRRGANPPPTTLDELAKLSVVVQDGDLMHGYLLANGFAGRLTVTNSQEAMLRAVAEGRADCALGARMPILRLVEDHGWPNLELGRKPFLVGEYSYAARAGETALLAQFDEGLAAVKASGEFRRLHEKWLGHYDTDIPRRTVLRYIALIAGPLLAIMLMALAWSWGLRRLVAQRTAELCASTEFQRAMIACSPVALYSYDLAGKVLSWNASAERIYGWSAEEVIGQDLPTVRPDQRHEVAKMCDDVMTSGGFLGRELIRQRKDGSQIPVSLSAAPLHDSSGKLIAVMSAAEDISARHQARQELQESHALLENLARQVPGVIYQYRLWPDGRSAFPYASPGLNDIYEVTPEEVREDATAVFERLHPEDRDRVSAAIFTSAESLETFHCRFRVLLPRQGLRWRWCQAEPQRMEDGGTLWHGMIIDTTEAKEAEEEQEKLRDQLTQAQKMESVGQLAGGVAHDFNNMLTIILGNAELALAKLSPTDPLAGRLSQIKTAGKHSADITRQLLAFARKQAIMPRVLSLNEAVEGMMKMLRRLIGEHIDLVWRPQSDLWPVNMDPSQVDQILANLCVNAHDAITGNGKIAIETDNVTFDETYCASHAGFSPGDYVLLAVSDDGCGMDAATMEQIFEPFFTTKGVGEGTGLGLATVYGIVKQNLGFINVYSEPGQGTTFRIYLSRHLSQDDVASAEDASLIPLGKGETVLIVEDEPGILNMAELMLVELGYTVLTASSPGEAMRQAQLHAGRVHLLLTDVMMPEMNGRMLAEQLIERYPRLKCLFMSGYSANVIAHRGVLEEGVHFIQKPFSLEELARHVRNALDAESTPATAS